MGRPARIDRAAILDAGLALVDENGAEGVTMAAIADRLGVSTMALYRHVGDKAGLLDGVVERVLAELPRPDPRRSGWERLTASAEGMRALARAHPRVVPLLLARPVRTPDAVAVRDALVDALVDEGVPPARAPSVERIMSSAVLGFLVGGATERFAAHDPAARDADWQALLALLRSGLAGVRRSS